MEAFNSGSCRYRYNALDQLTGLEPVGQATLQRFYRLEHLATEVQGPASQSVLQHGTQLLALQTREDDNSHSQLLATDQQRSVLRVNDPAGSVQRVYTAYGYHPVKSGLGSLLGFNGEAVDPVTGHYLLGNGHRAFNPVLMRFNSPDKLSPFNRGGLNSYAYCLGNPVSFSDPTGQFAEIGRLVTSLLSVVNARIVMSPAIPYKLAKDALRWGAAGQLPFKYTIGAAGSTVAGVATMMSALTGTASAVAAMTGDSEAANTLGFVALGLAGLTLVSRLGSYWAARDPKTILALKSFVEGRKHPVAMPSPVSEVLPASPLPSAPPATPGSPQASAPFLTPGPIGFDGFKYPENNGRAVDFLNRQLDRQLGIFKNARRIRRHST
ncbi:hypothetical protein PS838_04430 [Pseudomonas fluorescens]|nr:hypothetical protein PS838_04430 [Pseudomonas fluorescens]